MRTCGEDVTEIEVKPDGSWRVKPVNERRCLGDLTQWHFPDGSLCMQTDKEAEDSSVNRRQANIENSGPGSGRDGENLSVNQDGGINFEPVYEFTDQIQNAPVGDADVIILSDLEEENEPSISSGPKSKSNGSNAAFTYGVPAQGILDSYPRDSALGPEGGSSRLGFFNNNNNEFGVPLWPLTSADQEGPSFDLVGSEADVSGNLVDLPHDLRPLINSYSLNADTASASNSILCDSSLQNYTTDINDSFVDNPLVCGSVDPSLQIFLSSRPSDAAAQTGMSDQPNMSNGIPTEDWISLRIGNRRNGIYGEPPAVTGSNSEKQLPSKEGALASLANTAGPNPSDMAGGNKMPIENQDVIEIDDSDDEKPKTETASASKVFRPELRKKRWKWKKLLMMVHDDDEVEEEEKEKDVKTYKEANKRKRSSEKGQTSGGGVGNNARSTEALKDEAIFDLGIVNRPKNPYFVAKLDPKRKNYLRVPTYVIKDFNLKLPKKIDICEGGRIWSADVKNWHDGRTYLTFWKSFLRWNLVDPNDRCLCEFVRENDGRNIQLNVRIVRATSLVQ